MRARSTTFKRVHEGLAACAWRKGDLKTYEASIVASGEEANYGAIAEACVLWSNDLASANSYAARAEARVRKHGPDFAFPARWPKSANLVQN